MKFTFFFAKYEHLLLVRCPGGSCASTWALSPFKKLNMASSFSVTSLFSGLFVTSIRSAFLPNLYSCSHTHQCDNACTFAIRLTSEFYCLLQLVLLLVHCKWVLHSTTSPVTNHTIAPVPVFSISVWAIQLWVATYGWFYVMHMCSIVCLYTLMLNLTRHCFLVFFLLYHAAGVWNDISAFLQFQFMETVYFLGKKAKTNVWSQHSPHSPDQVLATACNPILSQTLPVQELPFKYVKPPNFWFKFRRQPNASKIGGNQNLFSPKM